MSQIVTEITQQELDAKNRELWLKAMTALQGNNHKFASHLILPVVQENPGFLEGRQTLRKCQAAVVGGDTNSGGSKFFGISRGGGGAKASSKLKSLAKKDPVAAMAEIEKELSNDPFSTELNDLLHLCAIQIGSISTAEFALETIHEYRPQEVKYLHKLAQYYIGDNKFEQAAKVFSTITKQDPACSIAIKGEKDCMAKASMLGSTNAAGGLKMKDDAERVKLEKAAKTGLTKDQLAERRDELLLAYQANQHDLNTARDLGDVYERLDDFPHAYQFYSWAFQLSDSDSTLQGKADAMKQKTYKIQMKQLEDALAVDPNNEELLAQLTELKQSSAAERIVECEARVDENPTDGVLRYDLGKAYFDAGQPENAIPHLQQAKSNPAIETKVLLLLGQTFDAKGMTDMAIGQLDRAKEKLIEMDGVKKEVLYQLGILYEKAGNKEGYLNALKEIYEVDYGYRDVATRVESAY